MILFLNSQISYLKCDIKYTSLSSIIIIVYNVYCNEFIIMNCVSVTLYKLLGNLYKKNYVTTSRNKVENLQQYQNLAKTFFKVFFIIVSTN